MSEILKVIFGDFTLVQLVGYLWFFLIGYIVYGLNEATSRSEASLATPKKWSWKFWFLDNWRRYLTTFISTYVLFRFYTEVSGHPFGNFDAVALGLIGDGIAATMKEKFKTIAGDRVLLTAQINQEQKVAQINQDQKVEEIQQGQ